LADAYAATAFVGSTGCTGASFKNRQLDQRFHSSSSSQPNEPWGIGDDIIGKVMVETVKVLRLVGSAIPQLRLF